MSHTSLALLRDTKFRSVDEPIVPLEIAIAIFKDLFVNIGNAYTCYRLGAIARKKNLSSDK